MLPTVIMCVSDYCLTADDDPAHSNKAHRDDYTVLAYIHDGGGPMRCNCQELQDPFEGLQGACGQMLRL